MSDMVVLWLNRRGEAVVGVVGLRGVGNIILPPWLVGQDRREASDKWLASCHGPPFFEGR